MRFARVSCLLLLAPMLLGAASPRPKTAAAPPAGRLEIGQSVIEATPEMAWTFDVILFNALPVGLYADSAALRLEDAGPGVTGLPRMQIFPMPSLAQSISSLSANDSVQVNQSLPAAFETGSLQATLYAHTNDGRKVAITSPVVAVQPGVTSKEHPSELLVAGGQKVEVVSFPSRVEGLAPGLLVVHDHGSNARQLFTIGFQLSTRGYSVLFVSLPGYGLSEGTADPASTQTLAALGAALDHLKRSPGVDSTRLGAWGFGLGATGVARLAESRSDLKAMVAQSGYYAGVSPANVHGATLVLHGLNDSVAPVAQAQAFAAELAKGPAAAESKFVPNLGHQLSRTEVRQAVLPFLETRLKK